MRTLIGTPHTIDTIYKDIQELGAKCLILKMFQQEYRANDVNKTKTQTLLLNFEPEYGFTGIYKYAKYLVKGIDYTVTPKRAVNLNR